MTNEDQLEKEMEQDLHDIECAEYNRDLSLIKKEIDKILFRMLSRQWAYVEVQNAMNDLFESYKRK